MRVPAIRHCEHKYWDVNSKYRYRICRFCFKKQYNYTGKWEDEITINRFIAHWTPLDGHNHVPRITIEGCQLFEFQCYESWNVAIKIKVERRDGEPLEFGPFINLNQAQIALERVFGKHKSWETFDGRIAGQ